MLLQIKLKQDELLDGDTCIITSVIGYRKNDMSESWSLSANIRRFAWKKDDNLDDVHIPVQVLTLFYDYDEALYYLELNEYCNIEDYCIFKVEEVIEVDDYPLPTSYRLK